MLTGWRWRLRAGSVRFAHRDRRDHLGVGCWVFGRPAAGTGAPTSRLPHHWHSDTLSHACWVGLAAHKADSFSGCGQACAYTTLLLPRIAAQNRLHRLSISGTGGQQQGREDHRRPHDASPTGRAPRLWRLNDDLKPVACGATRRPHGQVSVAAGMSQLQIENYAQVIGNLPVFLRLGVASAKHRRVLFAGAQLPGRAVVAWAIIIAGRGWRCGHGSVGMSGSERVEARGGPFGNLWQTYA